MLFNSIEFLIFFPIVIFVYYLIPNKLKSIWLLVASYYFYMSWNATYVWLILIATLVTWICGLGIGRLKQGERKKGQKALVAISFVVTLGILFFFKYFDFALSILNSILKPLHLTAMSNPFDLLLPVGISFYTFQTLSYVVDVYRDKIPAEKNLLRYALFVSFFPQLVAGPIERATNLLPQFQRPRTFRYEQATDDMRQMLWGFFKKLIIADNCAGFVNYVFDNYAEMGSMIQRR